jgi:hypothetical protein
MKSASLVALTCTLVVACASSGSDTVTFADPPRPARDASTADASVVVVGASDGGRTDATTADANCVGVESTATVVKRPIDFIILPDESGSMGTTRDAVANAMQREVKNALDAAGIDYKVIWHGSWPLASLAGKVTYNNVALGSGNGTMFKPVLDTFDAWSPALRANALKVFVQFTDGTSGIGGAITGYSGSFDDVLLAKSPTLFGTASARKFSHHVFIGVREKPTAADPWLPSEAVVGVSCGTNYVAASPLENLAKRNEGFRFPLCRPDLFAGVFDRIARTAIQGATLPCELVIPPPPSGSSIAFNTVALKFKAGDGTERVFLRARNESECAADRFLLDEATRRITLCAAACTAAKADPRATLTVLSGCDPKVY